MTAVLPKPAGSLLVVSPADPRPPAAGTKTAGFARGQSVLFQVLSAGRAGELRLRIGTQVFSAVSARPLPEGASGRAVVSSLGPPLLLQVSEWPAAAKPRAGFPVLLGREPVRAGAPGECALEKWNASLDDPGLPREGASSAAKMRDGILLSRFLVFSLGGAQEGEKPARKEGPSAGGGKPGADPAAADPEAPFWFFIPFRGERGPLLFPGYRRRERGEAKAGWAIFLRLPDVGPVSARLAPAAKGWRLLLLAEDEALARVMAGGAAELAGAVRAKGLPLVDVAVRKMPKGQIEAEVAAKMSQDTGIPLVERDA